MSAVDAEACSTSGFGSRGVSSFDDDCFLIGVFLLELHTGVGISVGIGWYFVGIIPTNTNGKLGW